MGEKMKKLLIFHSALAPYRIDFFNFISTQFNTTVTFLSKNNRNQNFNQKVLQAKSIFRIEYLEKKIVVGDRDFNLGYSKSIKKHRPNIIIGGEFGLPVLIPYLYKRITGGKYTLYTICDDSLLIAQNCRGLRRQLRNFLAPRLDGIIVLSDEVSLWYQKNIHLKNKPIVFPLIRDDEKFREELCNSLSISQKYFTDYNLENKTVFLFVGRLEKVKNIDRIMESFAKIRRPNDLLVIVGTGTLQEELIELRSQLQADQAILFPGRFEGYELLAWYLVADYFILASKNEPFGAVVNEALSAGCPVICSKTAGASSLVDESNGILVDVEHNFELQSAMLQIIERFPRKTNKNYVYPSLMVRKFENYTTNLINVLNDEG